MEAGANLHGMLAVVTGAASGIGAALATRLAERDARLVLADTDAERLHAVSEQLGAEAVVTDVADPAAMARLAERAPTARFVCLNAGVVSSHPGPVWEAPPEEWDLVMGVNLGGVVNGLRAFVPRLLASGEPGQLLVTASLAGVATWPGGGPYAASKHAVVAVAEQTALSIAGSRVGITVLCPALVRSGMSEMGEDPLDVADAALHGVADGRFLVLPDEWREAVRHRGEGLAAGEPPRLPEPSP